MGALVRMANVTYGLGHAHDVVAAVAK
eukprot:COSAG01_NODE_13631_length_1556_cov_6.530542_1_plen_26_part_10